MANLVLISLSGLDLILSLWGFFFPAFWFSFFHDSTFIDPQSLLARCAANWTAFFLLQVTALLRWKKWPWLLLLVAGARLSDIFTDITCLLLASKVTIYAVILFPVAGAGNLLCGVFLIKSYLSLNKNK